MTIKVMQLRRDGACATCASVLVTGTTAQWDSARKTVTCLECAGDDAPENAQPLKNEPKPSTPARTKPASGQAGASAELRYQELHARREHAIDERFGRFAGIVKFLSDDPQSIRAWAKGSSGERALADALERHVGDRAVLLHDRRVPRSSANIDHLVIASSGIWIIDAKKYSGPLTKRDKGGWFKTDVRVYVNNRDQTKLIQGPQKQSVHVLRALQDRSVPIYQVLCFVDVEWQFFLKPFQIDDVWITYAKHLIEMIEKPGPLNTEEVLELGNLLAEALPSK